MSEKMDQSSDDFPMIYTALIEEIKTRYNRNLLTLSANRITQPITYINNHRIAKIEIAERHYLKMMFDQGRIIFYYDIRLLECKTHQVIEHFVLDISDPHFFKKCNRALRYLMTAIKLHIEMESDDSADFTIQVMTAEK